MACESNERIGSDGKFQCVPEDCGMDHMHLIVMHRSVKRQISEEQDRAFRLEPATSSP